MSSSKSSVVSYVHSSTVKLHSSCQRMSKALCCRIQVSPNLSLSVFRYYYCSSFTSSASSPITSRQRKCFRILPDSDIDPQELGQDQPAQTWRKTPAIPLDETKTLIVSRYVDWCVSMAAGQKVVNRNVLLPRGDSLGRWHLWWHLLRWCSPFLLRPCESLVRAWHCNTERKVHYIISAFPLCLPIFHLSFPVSPIHSYTSSVVSPLPEDAMIWLQGHRDSLVSGILLFDHQSMKSRFTFQVLFDITLFFFVWQQALTCGRLPNYIHPPLQACTHTRAWCLVIRCGMSQMFGMTQKSNLN